MDYRKYILKYVNDNHEAGKVIEQNKIFIVIDGHPFNGSWGEAIGIVTELSNRDKHTRGKNETA